MQTFGKSWFPKGSLMAEFSESFGSNITRQKSTMALHAAKVEAELASKSKSEFIANMSHELRTPLNAVIGFADMLSTLKISDPERVNQYSTYIREAAEHLLALINDILDVSKMQAGKLEVDPQAIDVNDVMEGCKLIISAKAKEKNISLKFEAAENLEKAYADPLRVKQILINLLSNAVKFTPENGQITCTTSSHGNGFVSVSVADTGAGMTEKEVDTALRPFGQVHSGFDKRYDGTGLGLPISVALAKLHNGDLRIKSIKDQGTIVTLYLPVSGSGLAADSETNQQITP